MIKFPVFKNSQDGLSLIKSISFVGQSEDGREFLAWINSEVERLDVENRYEINEVDFRRRQGACMTLHALLAEILNVDETYNTLKKSEKSRSDTTFY